MSDVNETPVGAVFWVDLTVNNADEVRDFYEAVVGWKPAPVNVGDYNDYNMNQPENGQTAAGICHAQATNANLPQQWLIYIMVENLQISLEACKKLGGKILVEPQENRPFGIIQDPAGAVAALYQKSPSA